MNASLRPLLSGVVDYAGLFPPARLPLDQAIRNYAHYRQEADAWMLGRFVIPAGRLIELQPYQNEFFGDGSPFVVSVLGPTEPGWVQFRKGLEETLGQLDAFRQRHGGRVIADVLEMKIPADIVDESDLKTTADRLNEIGAIIETGGYSDLSVFFEFGFDAGLQALSNVLDALVMHTGDAPPRAGFKLHCGGLEASAFPTTEQVAFVIRRAVMYRIALKATAGLHHPIRRFDAAVQTHMHGFINVFGAGVLVHAPAG